MRKKAFSLKPTNFSILIFALAGILAHAQTSGQPKDSHDIYPKFALGVMVSGNLDFTPKIGAKVNDIPDNIRTVPSHPDDTWIYGKNIQNIVIPAGSIEPNPVTFMGSFSLGPEITYKRLRARGGINFSAVENAGQGLTKSNQGATREINQSGSTSRGYGRSLVYINMFVKASYIPGFFGEASLNLTRNVAILGGVAYKNFNLMVENGYDRYDSLETNDTFKAARVKVPRYYGGFGIEFPYREKKGIFIGGVQFLAGKIPDIPIKVGGMTVSVSKNWFFSLGISLSLSWVRF